MVNHRFDPRIPVEIDTYLEFFPSIPKDRKYWIVRTNGGEYFESFLTHKFIALGYSEIKLSKLTEIRDDAQNDPALILKGIREYCARIYDPEERRTGLIAGQVFRFVFEMKKGDIVIIPSANSETLAFGEITTKRLIEVTPGMIEKTGCPYNLRKHVNWKKTVRKSAADILLAKTMQSHQAVSDITHHGDIIERTLGTFYIKDDIGNLILDVDTRDQINAKQLFDMGHYLLNHCDHFIKSQHIPVSINDIGLQVNLNSPGKIQFQSKTPKVLFVLAVLFISLRGGGGIVKVPGTDTEIDLSTNGLVQLVAEYQKTQDSSTANKVMESVDSLKVQPPADVIEVLDKTKK